MKGKNRTFFGVLTATFGVGFLIFGAVFLIAAGSSRLAGAIGAQGSALLRLFLAGCCGVMGLVMLQVGTESVHGKRPAGTRLGDSACTWLYIGSMVAASFVGLVALMSGWYFVFAVPVLGVAAIPVLLIAHAQRPTGTTRIIHLSGYGASPKAPTRRARNTQSRVASACAAASEMNAEKNEGAVPTQDPGPEPGDPFLVFARPRAAVAAADIDTLSAQTRLAVFDLRRGLNPAGPARPVVVSGDEDKAREIAKALEGSGIPAAYFRRSRLTSHWDDAIALARFELSGDIVGAISKTGDRHDLHRTQVSALWLGQREGRRDPYIIFAADGRTFYVDAVGFDFSNLPLQGVTVVEKIQELAELLARASEQRLERFFFDRDTPLSTSAMLDGAGAFEFALLQTLSFDQGVSA